MIAHQTAAARQQKHPPVESNVEVQKRLIQELELFEDWSDRYQILIEFGRRLEPIPDALKTERNRIRSCRGDTWIAGELRGGILHLWASSETDIVNGLLAAFVEVYAGRPASDVFDYPFAVLDAVGLTNRLSPHRLAALQEIVERLRELAIDASVSSHSA